MRWPALDDVLLSEAEWTITLRPTAKHAQDIPEAEVAADEIEDVDDLVAWATDHVSAHVQAGAPKVWLECVPADDAAAEERDELRRRHGPGACRRCVAVRVQAEARAAAGSAAARPTRARARAREASAASDEADQIRARTEALRAKAELLEAERELERRMRAGEPDEGSTSILRELLAELREARKTPSGGLGAIVQLLPVITPLVQDMLNRSAEREAALIQAIGQIGSHPPPPPSSPLPAMDAPPPPAPAAPDPIDATAKVLPLITQLVELARELGGAGGGERSLVGEVAEAVRAFASLRGPQPIQPRPVVRPAPAAQPAQTRTSPAAAGQIPGPDPTPSRTSEPPKTGSWPPPPASSSPSSPEPAGDNGSAQVEQVTAEVVGRARTREWLGVVLREAEIGAEPDRVAEAVADHFELLPTRARELVLAGDWSGVFEFLDDVPEELRTAVESPQATEWCSRFVQALRELLLHDETEETIETLEGT